MYKNMAEIKERSQPESQTQSEPEKELEIKSGVNLEKEQKLGVEKLKTQELENPRRIKQLKEKLSGYYNKTATARELGKKVLKGSGEIGVEVLKGGLVALPGLILKEIFSTLWKETKIMSKTLWRMARGQKPPSFSEIWREFFPKKEKKND